MTATEQRGQFELFTADGENVQKVPLRKVRAMLQKATNTINVEPMLSILKGGALINIGEKYIRYVRKV